MNVDHKVLIELGKKGKEIDELKGNGGTYVSSNNSLDDVSIAWLEAHIEHCNELIGKKLMQVSTLEKEIQDIIDSLRN